MGQRCSAEAGRCSKRVLGGASGRWADAGSNEPIIRASFVGRPTNSGLRATRRAGAAGRHTVSGHEADTRRAIRSGSRLRRRQALLRARFRECGGFGRHPVQCGAEPGQHDGRLGARRRLVAAGLTSGHAGSPAAPLARSDERDASNSRAAEHAHGDARPGSACARVRRRCVTREAATTRRLMNDADAPGQ